MITQTNDPSRQSTVKPIIGSSTAVNDNTMLASYQTAPVSLPGGVQPCTCAYLSWGFWSSNINYSNNRTDNINLGTYVVGQLTDRLQMPQIGQATYNGMMVGNVQNGSNAYVGAGTYNMGWDFRQRGGSFNATFDGTNYSGGAIANPGTGGVSFTGAFGNIASGRAGVLVGSFFGPQAQNQGGSFAIGGPRPTRRPASSPGSGRLATARDVRGDEVGDAGDVVARKAGNASSPARVGRDRDDVVVGWSHRPRFVRPHLDLGMGCGLESFDQHQVGRREPRQHLGEARLLLLAHDGEAPGRHQRDLGGARRAMAKGIGAGMVDVGGVVRVLDRRDRPAAAHELGDQPLGERRLACVLPAGDAEQRAHASIRSPWA